MFNSKINIKFSGLSKTIGISYPVFIVSEIGINHNGDLSLAKECISASVEAGADAVKFQNYDVDDFIINEKVSFSYLHKGKKVSESQRKMFERCQFSFAQYIELKEYAKKEKIILFTTPSGINGVNEIQKLGLPIIKNASDSLNNLTLVKKIGETGKTSVLSTGMSTLSEIEEAVKVFRKTKNNNLVLLVCTSNYPTKPENVNLSRIISLAKKFGCLVGFSDHTEGNYSAIGATILGSVYIEKHFTIDKKLKGPDHWFSADPDEFKKYVDVIRDTEKSIGNGLIGYEKSEIKPRRDFLLTLTFNKSIKKGSIISEDDIIFARPGTGLAPKYISDFTGKRLLKDVSKGDKLAFNMARPIK